MTRRSDLRTAVPLLVLLVAGIVVMSLDHSDTVLTAVGLSLLALGAIGLVSLAFYIVGRSEDEERRNT